jgi:hypothetical protein
MRLLKFLSPAFCWTCIFLLGAEILLRSSIQLQSWLTRDNTPGVLSPYLYNYHELRRQGRSVKLLLIGDSIPMMAVDAPQLARELGMKPEEVFNFSHGGAGPASHLHNFTKLRSYLPNLKSIIIFVQYKRLNQILANAQTMAEDLIMANDQPLSQAWQTGSLNSVIYHYSLVFRLAPLVRWQDSRQPFPGFRPRPGGGTMMNDIIPSPPRLPEQDLFKANYDVISSLYTLLEKLKENGLTTREYIIPYNPEYQKDWQGGEEDRFGRQLFGQLADSGLIEFFPDAFNGLEKKLKPYYLDGWHLTPSGTRMFTSALARHLREHPLPGIPEQSIPGAME